MGFRRFFIPSDENGYAPTALEGRSAAIMLFLVLLTFASVTLQSSFTIRSDWFISSILPAVLYDLTNEERADESLTVLLESDLLDNAATLKAKDMAEKGYFAHKSPNGRTPWYWFNKVGYDYLYAGENLAVLFTDSGDVVDAWMDSPGHRANIMNDEYTEIGFGTAKGMYKGKRTVFIAQLFGTPFKDVPSAATSHAMGTDGEGILEPDRLEEALVAETGSASDKPEVLSESAVVGGEVIQSTFATTSREFDGAEMTRAEGSASREGADAKESQNYFAHILAKPTMIISFVYLILALYIAGLLACSVVIEWRQQHPVQVAYGVGLLTVMMLMLHIHIALSSSALIL